MEWY